MFTALINVYQINKNLSFRFKKNRRYATTNCDVNTDIKIIKKEKKSYIILLLISTHTKYIMIHTHTLYISMCPTSINTFIVSGIYRVNSIHLLIIFSLPFFFLMNQKECVDTSTYQIPQYYYCYKL